MTRLYTGNLESTVRFPVRGRYFSLSNSVKNGSRVNLAYRMGIATVSLGIKRPKPPSKTEVKNA
jgi:hypothetical protein